MFQIIRQDRKYGHVMEQHCLKDRENGNLEYLTFPKLQNTGIVEHLFTTRMGGISKGIFSTMNLSFTRGDDTEAVFENYRRIGKVLGCDVSNMVLSQQTHTTNIRVVSRVDCGKGIVRERDYTDVDGLITDEEGIALVTFFADCVPLYFVDPVHHAIGLAHSGWKGTVAQMAVCMVKKMQEKYGSSPENLITAIGPSICQECYEVSEDVAVQFQRVFTESCEEINQICDKIGYQKNSCVVAPGKEPGKYQLDLWLANVLLLNRAGIMPEHISVTDICTCHNPEYLFSHRASAGRRGNLAAFLMLKES